MTFRLALAMGEVDPDDMLSRISEKTFQEWCAFYLLSPWGNEWRQTAKICREVANSIPGRRVAAKEDEFMPFKPPTHEQSAEEMRATLKTMLAGRRKKRGNSGVDQHLRECKHEEL